MTNWKIIKNRMEELNDLYGIVSLLDWDQETNMPEKGIISRTEQLSTMYKIIRNKLIEKGFGKELKKALNDKKLNKTKKRIVEILSREVSDAKAVPEKLIIDLTKAQSIGLESWDKARKENNFNIFKPSLKELIRLTKESAQYTSKDKEIYNSLLDDYEPGLTVEVVEKIADKLIPYLSNKIKEINNTKQIISLKNNYKIENQRNVANFIFNKMGLDNARGKYELVDAHPFTTSMDLDDVRLTVRPEANSFIPTVMAALHEGGHALYDLGVDKKYRRTPIACVTHMAAHESQSLFWENCIGRSYEFWQFLYPTLKKEFSIKKIPLDKLYKELNRVNAGPIRLEADEVSYNLHIAIRFKIELALMRGEVNVNDIEKLWNDMYIKYLGLKPKNSKEGILQDVHWSCGLFGYFPSYMIGSIYAASIYKKMKKELDLSSLIRKGNLIEIREWLRDNIHKYGRMYSTKKIMGGEPRVEDLIEYFEERCQ